MDYGTLCNNNAQGKWHNKQSERLVKGSRQSALYSGFTFKRNKREHENSEDCGRFARGEVLRGKIILL
jgi:hypothetical protein